MCKITLNVYIFERYRTKYMIKITTIILNIILHLCQFLTLILMWILNLLKFYHLIIFICTNLQNYVICRYYFVQTRN